MPLHAVLMRVFFYAIFISCWKIAQIESSFPEHGGESWNRQSPTIYSLPPHSIYDRQLHEISESSQSFDHIDAAGTEEFHELQKALERRDRSEVCGYIGEVLMQLCIANDQLKKIAVRLGRNTAFHSINPPKLSIWEYVKRVATYMKYPNICFILSLAYIDRLSAESSDVHVYVNSLTAHRLFASALLVAAKFVVDYSHVSEEESSDNNSFFQTKFDDAHYIRLSQVTGIAPRDLRRLEYDFLQALDQNAFVSAEELVRYAGGLLGDDIHPDYYMIDYEEN